jgi:GAF domain-containing protein
MKELTVPTSDQDNLLAQVEPSLAGPVDLPPVTLPKGKLSPADILNLLHQITQALNTSLHLPEVNLVCQTILQMPGLSVIFQFDFAQICLLNLHTQTLITAQYWPTPSGDFRQTQQPYRPDEGYTGWIIARQNSLLITDTHHYAAITPQIGFPAYPYLSYLGVPLKVGAKLLGTLELAAIPSEAFNQSDLITLETIAAPAAVVINHARLYQDTHRKLVRQSLLFDASRNLSSTLSYDELLFEVCERMLDAFNTDACVISSFDEDTGVLTLLQQAKIDSSYQTLTPSERKNGLKHAVMIETLIVVSHFPALQSALKTQNSLIIRTDNPAVGPHEVDWLKQHHYGAMAAVPMIGRDKVTGLVQLLAIDPNAFSEDDLWLAQALVSQANIALQNAQLFNLTDQQLQQRVDELAGLQRVSAELNSTLDLNRLLNIALEEARRVTQADFGSVNLYDARTGQLVAHTEHGWFEQPDGAGRPARPALFLSPMSELMAQALHTSQAVLVGDVQIDDSGPNLGGDQTRSKAIVPILYGGEPAGLINLESTRPNFFNQAQLRYLEALANQAGVAIGNTQAYQEQKRERERANRRADQLGRLSEISNAFRTNRPLPEVLEDIAYAIVESVGFNVVLMSLIEGNPPVIVHQVGAGIPISQVEALKYLVQPHPLANLQAVMQAEFRLGSSYFIPTERSEVWLNHLDVPRVEKIWSATHPANGTLPKNERAWQPDDVLFVPLTDTHKQIIGLLTVADPDTGERPDALSLQTLEIFANHAAAAIENARLFTREQQRRRLADTLRGLAEVISSKLNLDELLNIVLQELAKVIEYDSATVQLLQGDQLVVIGGRGRPGSQPLVGLSFSMEGRNPSRRVMETQEPLIIRDVQLDYPAAFAQPPHNQVHSWLGLPLTYGTNVLGVMAVDNHRIDFFTQEDAGVVLAFANQVAVALQNAHLFEEAQQQVRQLAALTRVGQSLNRALNVNEVLNLVLDAVFDLVGDHRGSIWLIDRATRTVKMADTKNVPPFLVGLFNESAVSIDSEPFAPVITSGQVVVIKGSAGRDNIANFGLPFPDDVTYVPLKTGEGVIGILAIETVIHNKNMLKLVTTLADLAAVAIDRARLLEHIRRFTEELERRVALRTEELARTLQDLTEERDRFGALYQITRELSASLDLDRILSEALSLINRAIGISQGAILLLDHETGRLIFRSALGRARSLPRSGEVTRYRLGYGLAGKVIETRQPRIVPNLANDPDWVVTKDMPERRSALAVPLITGEDALGALLLFHPESDYFTEDHLKMVTAAATQIATAINNAELYRLITDQAQRLGVMLRTQATETAKNQAILQSITDGVLVLDPDRNVVLVNPKAAEILQVEAHHLENRPITWSIGQPRLLAESELLRLFYQNLLAALTAVEAGEPSAEFRFEVGKKAVAVTLAPVTMAGEESPGLVAVLRDISREAEIERLKNEFISTVSHELRTPMTSIKGYADLLTSGSPQVGELNPVQYRFVQVIQANADRLSGLVNDILEISRIETGRIKLELESLDLAQVIEAVAVSFEGQMGRKAMNLSLNLAQNLPSVYADRARVTQILVNLVGNAWQYTPEGGRITIHALALDDHFVQIDVEDTGIGIVEQDIDYVFDRFFRSERTEVQVVDGTGLGLSITRMFVEMLGGKIWLKSQLDVGSTFSFTLPINLSKN